MIKTGKTKEEKSFLSKSLACQFCIIKERKKKKRKKNSNYVNERTPFLVFSDFFTLISDVFEKKCKEIEYLEVC